MDHNFRNLNSSQHTKKFSKKFKGIKFALTLIGAIILVFFVWVSINPSSTFDYSFPKIFPVNPIKSTDGRVNVLLLGNAGGMHDGPDLTDSIIVASLNLNTHKVVLISIPRDLWVESAKAKINAIYEFGERKGGGLKYAEDKIDDILGIPIHYGVRLDFNGFQKAVDLVDGVEVDVPKTFDDYNYPITGKEDDLCGLLEKEVELTPDQIKALNVAEEKLNPVSPQPSASPNPDLNAPKRFKVLMDENNKIATDSSSFACRFEHLHFDRGMTSMDGETSLKFVRSRMGTNGEGSDFARSRRQQLVIQAFRAKALSLQTLSNPKTVTSLIGTLGKSVETDIPLDKYLEFYSIGKKIDAVESVVLGDLGNGKSVLISPPPSEYSGVYILIPPKGDFTQIKEYIKQRLE